MIAIGSGLSNLGNTCFLNATLQCLLHAPAFVKLLQQKLHSQHCNTKKWCVFCEFQRLWHSTQQQKAVQPVGLVRGLPQLFKKFRLGRQEDAHEFLRYVVQGLQKSDIDSTEKKPQRIRQLIEASQLFRAFGGKMKSSIECLSCHNKSEITQHFYDMSLECQRSNSVGESLEGFFRVDLLEGDNRYRCEKCRKLVQAHKRFLFHKLPQVLTIQLKRFTNDLRKLDKFIKYEAAMNLTKYCDNQSKQVQYELFGVVVHEGRMAFSGHYYSFVQASDLNWYKVRRVLRKFDDSWVSRSNLQQSLSQKSYVLFYKLVQQQEPLVKGLPTEPSTQSNNPIEEEVEQPFKKQPETKKEHDTKKNENVQNNITPRTFEKKQTGINGVFQLVEKKNEHIEKKQERKSNKPAVVQMKRQNSFFEELQKKKQQHQPLLLLMEKHFSFESIIPSQPVQERKQQSSPQSSEQTQYTPSIPRPYKRPRCPSHQKALDLLRRHSRSFKKRRLNDSKKH